jgi:protocatechuate 3,4-dioxygenase beta subunit
VDAATTAPVPGAYVAYRVGDPEQFVLFRDGSVAVSGRDGTFRIPVMAGKGFLRITRPVYGYFVPNYRHRGEEPSHAIDIRADGPIAPVELKLCRGLVLEGTVRDASGAPVAGANVRAENAETPFRKAATQTDEQGRFRLAGLSPHRVTNLAVVHPRGGAQQVVVADQMHPWDKDRIVDLDVTLETGVTLAGRVLRAGRPQAGVQMLLYRNRPKEAHTYNVYAEETTDAEGRYAIAGMAPGDRYYFQINTADGATDPGWRYQSPYVKTIPATSGVLHLPDVQLVKRDQVLEGVVVDRQGHPVAGVRVSAMLPDGSSLVSSGGYRSSLETNEEGRFELRDLPDEPLELMAYRRNPAGGVIRYPSQVKTQRNQRDIRILFDPALDEPIEDLDAPRKP